MAAYKLEVGDVVFLKSDKQLRVPMTVSHLYDVTGAVRVIWWDSRDQLKGDDLPAAILMCRAKQSPLVEKSVVQENG